MKRTKCVVRNCDSGPESEVTFFPLPKEAFLRRRWLESASLSETDVNKRSKVCSKHFKKGDFAKFAKNSDPAKRICELQPEAVPSINLPLKSTFKIKISKRDNNKEVKVEEVKVKEEKEKVKMPKKAPPQYVPKVEVMPAPRTHARRAASKEALKQMQLLLDDEDDAVEIPDDDIQLIDPSPPPPPKKKYKISHRKSADGNADREVLVLKTITNRNAESTLELDCWVEQLDEVQQNRLTKLQAEEKEMEQKLKQLLTSSHAKLVHKGELTTIVEVTEQVNNALTAAAKPAPPPPVILNNSGGSQYQLMMDPRLGFVLGTVSTPGAVAAPPPAPTPAKSLHGKVTVAQNLTQPKPLPTTANQKVAGRSMRTRRGGKAGTATPPPATPPSVSRQMVQNKTTPQSQVTPPTRTRMQAPPVVQTPASRPQRGQAAAVAYSNARPSENNVEGGLMTGSNASTQGKKTRGSVVVDLTAEDGRANAPDSREISFNKLQGKTYPSLVVVARPHLRATADMQAERPKLDAKVKSVLMHPATKFTEWLIQQGLVKSEQKCSVHTNNQLKLGMYSDVSKFPYSGGYVWISECCPQRFVSVFSGSLFEGSPHPPMVILKLLYHWSCQTNIQNVTQWVKVDNLYVKGMYTWLRAICTVGLQSHLRKIGGPGVKVEIGVISLGTTSQDGNQRQVKVEVLGVLETASKLIRLRAVEPQADGDRNYKKRFSKIMEPVFQWVHPQSILVADLTVDKQTLHNMGFQHVVQGTSSEYGNNRAIMDYLRRIVPRMFQNTLSLLSRQIIQQFLDELVWREWYGINAYQAFNHLVQHLSEQTRLDSGMSLIVRLNKVAQNPFKNWAIPVAGAASTQPTPGAGSKGNATTPASRGNSTSVAAPAANAADGPPAPKKARAGRPPKLPPDAPKAVQQQGQEVNRPPKSTSPDVPEQMVPLENYYYGTIDTYSKTPRVVLNMKCPFCKSLFDNNIQLMSHLFKHAHNVSQDAQLCRYCLTSVPTAGDLLKHIASSHPAETKFDSGFVCLVCETQYMNPFILGKHMSKEHCPSELPYQCGTCGYRCSNHKQAIDHFYRTHDHGPTIQCPFCLKSTTVFSSSRNITQNVNYFIQHLQKHQRKQYARRCGKCNLWFVQKDVLKDHQMRMHVSQRGKQGLVPWLAPRNGVMVPKSKMDKYPRDADVINFDTLRYNVPNDLACKECSQPLDAPKHFPSFESCQNPNCQYSTCCTNAMQEHNAKCNKTGNPVAEDTLPFEMHCICGFCSTDGNQMAKHLAICEKKSAYPSKVKAKAATVTHSMLDVLGLVRKPDEGQTVSRNKATRTRKPEPVNDEKKAKKEEKPIKEEKQASGTADSTTEKDASDKAEEKITEDADTAEKTQTGAAEEATEKADAVEGEKMDTGEADKETEAAETENETNQSTSAPEENEDRSASKADEGIPDKADSIVAESDNVENRDEDSSKVDDEMHEDSSSKMETDEIEDEPSSTVEADDNPDASKVDASDRQNEASENQNEVEARSAVDASVNQNEDEDSSKVGTTVSQNELSSQVDASEIQNEDEESSKVDTAENEGDASSQVEASETQNEAEESPKVDTSENQEEARSEVDASEDQHENASENQNQDVEAAEPQDEIESADKESEEKDEDTESKHIDDEDTVEGENEKADTQKEATDGTEETDYVEDAKVDENFEVTKDGNTETESNDPNERQSNIDEDETQSSQGGESAAVESEARATEESQDEPEADVDENARASESPGLEDSTGVGCNEGSGDAAEKDEGKGSDDEALQVNEDGPQAEEEESQPQGEDESESQAEDESVPPRDSEPSDLLPTENSLEKGNCIEGEITSDDIQNLISDMVGDKQSMNFDDGSQSMGATQGVESDFGSERSKQMADMSVESMEECMNLPDGRVDDQPTPMETDQ